jgi:hypothetical protein
MALRYYASLQHRKDHGKCATKTLQSHLQDRGLFLTVLITFSRSPCLPLNGQGLVSVSMDRVDWDAIFRRWDCALQDTA